MKNIEQLKRIYKKVFSQKYYDKKIEELTEFEDYRCSHLAEVWAYIESVLPEGYPKYSIFDFEGYIVDKNNKTKKELLPKDIVLKAKKLICEYCWGMTWEDIRGKCIEGEEQAISFLRKNSIMRRRLENGNNLVFHGSHERRKGRTMLASIVMKEAIRTRLSNTNRGETYDWIDFAQLISESRKDSFILAEYRGCDWLVVDNIIKKNWSPPQKAFHASLIDPFFIDRFNYKLPTILVFKFDLRDEALDLEWEMGTGISKIVESNRTFMIPLSEEFKTRYNG